MLMSYRLTVHADTPVICTHAIAHTALQVEAVVRRIRHLTSADEDTKVLVFSTWQDLLDVVAHALTANGVPFAACEGRTLAQSVRDFQAGEAKSKWVLSF